MGVSKTTKGRLAVKVQASSWGTAETSFTSADLVEAVGPIVPPMPRETLSVDTYRPGNGAPSRVPGSKAGGTISLTIPLHGVSATTPTDNPTIHPDATIVRAALGSGNTDGYSATVTGGTAAAATDSSIPVAHAGFASLYPIGGGLYSVGWNSTVVASTSSTFLNGLAGTPAAGTALGSYVCWLSSTNATPLTIDWLGTDATAHIRYVDCLPSKITITLAAKQTPTMEVEFTFLSWTNVGSGGAPADYAYTYPRIPAFIGANGARTVFDDADACPKTVVIEITQALEQVECGTATDGADSLQWTDRMLRVSVTSTPPDWSASPVSLAPGDVVDPLQIDACTTPGRAFSCRLPAPQVAEQPTPVGNGNLLGMTTIYEGRVFAGDTGATAPADTPAQVAWL